MGSFFTNLQFFTGSGEKKQMHSKIKEILNTYICSLGFIEREGNENPDLTVAVSPLTEKPWISVYDQGTEDQDQKKLYSLLETLTKEISCYGVGITVHDSDVLYMVLYEKGKYIDSYDSNPLCFGEKLSKNQIEKQKAHPERWQKIIKTGYTIENLEKLFNNKSSILAEDELYSGYAEIFDWNKEFCTVGYNYLEEINTEGFSNLKFLLKNKVESEAKSQRSPVFKIHSHNTSLAGIVKFGFTFHFSFFNQGGESKGIRIVLWGSGLEQAIIDKKSLTAEIWLGSISNKHGLNKTVNFFPSQSRSDEQLLILEFPDFHITAGMKKDPYVFNYGQMKAQMDKFYSTHINVNLTGRYANPGKDKLYIGCVPLENLEHGSTSLTVPLDVMDSPRLPLNFVMSESNMYSFGVQSAIRQLSLKRIVFSMVVIPNINNDAYRVIQNIAQEWVVFIQENYIGTARHFFLQNQKEDKFNNNKIHFKNKYGSKNWGVFTGSVCANNNLLLTLPTHKEDISDTLELNERLHNSGFILSNKAMADAFTKKSSPDAKHICFWIDLHAFPENREKRAAALLEEFIEKIMNIPGSLQSFITFWDFSPHSSDIIATPYETACGIQYTGQTRSLDWCGSFLRMVSERMWIGKDLAGRISAFDDLNKCAYINKEDEIFKIILKPHFSIADLEKCLVNILPSNNAVQL